MTDPESHEQFVRANWDNVKVLFAYQAIMIIAGRGASGLIKLSQTINSLEPPWSAAYDFTVQRLKQIAEVEEEIAYFNYDGEWDITAIPKRIITRLEAALADLKRGMKP